MSLNGALNAAVSGLQAQSNALSVISTNIANASTTGYTTEDASFESLVSGSTGAQNNNSNYGGSGVATDTSYEMQTIGQATTTSTSTNIAMGSATNGFFVVSPGTTNTSASTDLYTRDGSFSQTDGGYLVNGSGDYLMGYATDADGNTTSTSVGQLSALTPVVVPPTVAAIATTTATLAANLPSGLGTAAEVTAGTATLDSTTSTLPAIDSLGNTQTINETWTNVSTASSPNTWILQLTAPTGTTGDTISPNVYQLNFNEDGTLNTISSGTLAILGDAASLYTATADTSTTSGTISFSLSGSTHGVDSSGHPVTDDLSNGAAPLAITLDLSSLTQDASTTSTNGIAITTNTTNGSLGGDLSSIAISATGKVSPTYANSSNSAATTTIDVAQIPLATFADEEGLTAISGSTFALSTTSGSPTLVTAGTEGTGALTDSAVNSSTTDTSTQFDDMITAEQAYSAAAQVVTYDTKMFDSLIQAVA